MTSRSTEPIAEPALAEAVLADQARTLLSAAAVRRSADRMLALALDGRLDAWKLDLDRLPATADFVARVVRDRYPSLDPPFHARWRHFIFNGRDLWREKAANRHWPSAAAAARAAFDLAIVSVLLDAGSGPAWRFHDTATGLTAARSEGLALASLRWFELGGLSADPADPLRVDAVALLGTDTRLVEAAFQSTASQPLVGAAGRAALLNRLGAVMQARPDLFALEESPRPGGLFDALARRASGGSVPAASILELLLEALGPIWQGRPSLGGVALGDCWPHPAFDGPHPADRYVPLHKLSQWLAYSLIEPTEAAGIRVREVEALTGLAEYRNGGLFVDMGVCLPRDATAFAHRYDVSDPFVVEWRALTVGLLDRIVPLVGAGLGLSPGRFLLGQVLEGGTWAAGRLIARERRTEGGPPFQISSDGTVF